MEERREWIPPQWGPVADPAPWGPWGPWGGGWRIPKWPDIWGPIDPAPLREKLIERIKVEDLVALQTAQLEAVQAQLQAQANLIGKQMEILAKYSKG